MLPGERQRGTDSCLPYWTVKEARRKTLIALKDFIIIIIIIYYIEHFKKENNDGFKVEPLDSIKVLYLKMSQ